MKGVLFELDNIRLEISFKSLVELRLILSFYQKHNLCKINIPCKNNLKKEFLLNSIKLSRKEFPDIDIIPHFSVFHEFKNTCYRTHESFIKFLEVVKYQGCKEVLLVSGSQKRSTLDSVEILSLLKYNSFLDLNDLSIGVAFNPYLPNSIFEDEIIRLDKKLKSGIVSSIWIQFGTDIALLRSRIEILSRIISSYNQSDSKINNIRLFGSVLIPSKQFLARFKFRPWKGVYCSSEFLESLDYANRLIIDLLKTYKQYRIYPIIETNTSTEAYLESLKMLLKV